MPCIQPCLLRCVVSVAPTLPSRRLSLPQSRYEINPVEIDGGRKSVVDNPSEPNSGQFVPRLDIH